MKFCKHICLSLFFIASVARYAYATWSIVVIDPRTKKIGIAGASCTNNVYGIGAIVPGKGAVVVQAMSNPFARAKGVEMLLADATPGQILEAMKDPKYDPDNQQYAIVSVQYADQPATHTGSGTTSFKGALTSRGISVQGNTLTSPETVQAVLDAVLNAQKDSLAIEDILMIGIETGARLGGDNRCGNIIALSAFLTVAMPGDDPKKPYLNLVVYGSAEKVNAVEALRQKFNSWKEKTGR